MNLCEAASNLHQRLVRVEVDDHKVRVKGVVVARIGGPPGIVAPIPAVVVVEGLALFRQGVDAALDVDLQSTEKQGLSSKLRRRDYCTDLLERARTQNSDDLQHKLS